MTCNEVSRMFVGLLVDKALLAESLKNSSVWRSLLWWPAGSCNAQSLLCHLVVGPRELSWIDAAWFRVLISEKNVVHLDFMAFLSILWAVLLGSLKPRCLDRSHFFLVALEFYSSPIFLLMVWWHLCCLALLGYCFMAVMLAFWRQNAIYLPVTSLVLCHLLLLDVACSLSQHH